MAATVTMAYPHGGAFPGYSQQYAAALYQTRVHQPTDGTPLSVNPYAGYTSAPQVQQYHPAPSHSRQPSHSPSSEDGNRPSLPSISNLLGIADGDRPSHEAAQQHQHQHQQQQQQQQQQQLQQQHAQNSQAMAMEQRQRIAYPVQDLSSSQRMAMPPTPPLRNDSVVDGKQSPSTISTGSTLSTQPHPYFVGSAFNNMEADHQRIVQSNFLKQRHSVPSQPNTSPYGTTTPYTTSPGAISTAGSFYSPTDAPQLYPQQQRPLPSNFPPTNPWEHHHYISPSSQATFPQSQDRYICQTCTKAFSRPSSLKIHSHSHTGEKPFRCPHAGCGKAFSVRSNMKRHERGCHTGGGGGMGGAQFVS